MDPEILLLGIILKEPENTKSKRHTIHIFIAVLYTIVKVRKQPECQSKCTPLFEWIICIYTMTYNSAIKKNEILPSATTWMDREGIVLSEVNQRTNAI